MKKLLYFLFVLMFLSGTIDGQSIREAIPRGSKIYVVFDNGHEYRQVYKDLDNWGYWDIMDSAKYADYTMKVYNYPSVAFAEFFDKDNKTVFKTKPVTYGTDYDLSIELIRKRIIKGKN